MKPKRIVDPSTDLAFVELPGGTVEVGLRKAERAALAKLAGDTLDMVEWPTPQKVKVAPFRVAVAPLPAEVVGPLVDAWEGFGTDHAHVSAADAAKVVAALGYRLLTDAEWEYVARSGGATQWTAKPGRLTGYKKNVFGVDGLGFGTWLAPTKGKKPMLAAAGGSRSQPWQSPAEAVMVHAAYRERAKLAPLLVAWDGVSAQLQLTSPTSAKAAKGAKGAKRAKDVATAKRAKDAATAKGANAAWDGDMHVVTGLRFVDIPGGSFEMGLSTAERARIEALMPAEHRGLFAQIADRCPRRKVSVAPFRCATAPITEERSKKLGAECGLFGGYACLPIEKVRAWAKKFGLRLLTEAEWEYVARDGGMRSWDDDLVALLERIPDPERAAPPYKNRFGIEGLFAATFVDDGALVRSTAWRDDGYPAEVDTYLNRMHTTPGRDWYPMLFAVATTTP